MNTRALAKSPELIHPALWRASQLAGAYGRHLDTGHSALSTQLPGNGWPLGNLIDILIQQPGIGELQLLQPALAHLANRPIALVQPPYTPQISAWAESGNQAQLLWLRPSSVADALWASEQILRSATFGALLLWQPAVRSPALRRLHLAAQQSDTLFIILRPLDAAHQPSPAPLRLTLRPAIHGVNVAILKRRGSAHPNSIHISLYPDTPRSSELNHAIMDRRTPYPPQSRSSVPQLAH